jgi:hypothetical protein
VRGEGEGEGEGEGYRLGPEGSLETFDVDGFVECFDFHCGHHT